MFVGPKVTFKKNCYSCLRQVLLAGPSLTVTQPHGNKRQTCFGNINLYDSAVGLFLDTLCVPTCRGMFYQP